jgi:AhpC/TSA family
MTRWCVVLTSTTMKTLTTTQELDSTRNLYRDQKIPKPALEIMDAATAELVNNAAVSHALQPGDIAPDFILPKVDGRGVRLYSELQRGPVVLVFYRGGWCPFFASSICAAFKNHSRNSKRRVRRWWPFHRSCRINR